jgi:hypothetical protein
LRAISETAGRDARLILAIETEQTGDLARALARHDTSCSY